eukprot:COSAG02_NODE_2507_length_8637_cov_2.877138_7_plen_54_part_00
MLGFLPVCPLLSDSYIKKVPHKDIIKFTLVQLLSLAVLYVVKSSSIGISCESN